MKVGLVCPYDLATPGGVQQISIELAEQLRQSGDEVVLVGAGAYASGQDDTTLTVGRTFRVRANRSVVRLTLSPFSWRRAHRALAGVDVIHLHEPFIPLLGWRALFLEKPMVVTFHAAPPTWATALYRLAPLIGRRMRRLVMSAVSETAARAIPAAWGGTTIVPNGLNVAAYDLPVGKVAHRVCFLGRDEPRKGLDVLLQAWPLIRQRVPHAELEVIGSSRSEPPPGVNYLGRISSGEKRRILASSQVYVAPNTGGESFGVVIAEAMAAGCAVVCSNLEAFREVLGDAGLLVEVGDIHGLAATASRLLQDPEAVGDLVRKARERVKRYDWSVVAASYRALYFEAVS